MKWDAVLRAARETILGDAVLSGIYGDAVQLMGADDLRVPRLDLYLVADGVAEQWNPITVQFSQWTLTLLDLRASERQLVRMFHTELPTTLGGMSMWAQYLDGGDLSVPSRDGHYGRAVRFRLTPLRELYEPSPYPT